MQVQALYLLIFLKMRYQKKKRKEGNIYPLFLLFGSQAPIIGEGLCGQEAEINFQNSCWKIDTMFSNRVQNQQSYWICIFRIAD